MKTTPSKHALLRSPFGGRGALLLLLLLPLWGLGGFSYAQTVTLLGEDFDNSEVTFSVTMSPATPTWVFVDYATYPHNPADMSRATFTSVLFDPSDAGTTLTTEKRGFWLERSATVTATLEGVSGMFSWCAYAISAPPNAVLNPDGGYTLRGTPPFTVNGVELAESATTFDPGTCIFSITDFTYNPDGFFPDPPAVTATAPATVCAGAVTFTATATGGTTTAMTYTWSIAGAETTTPDNPYITDLEAGEYTYTVFVTNANGCTSTVSAAGTVAVYAVPVVHAVSSETLCSGLTAALSATVSNITDQATYTWIIDGYSAETTTTNTYTTPALTATASTNIIYTVQITNDSGCSSEVAAGTITVNPLPVPEFDSAPTAPVCPNTEVTFTVSGAGDGGLYCFTYECSECVRNPFLTGQEVPAAAHCLWDSKCEFGAATAYSVMLPDAGSMNVWVQAMTEHSCISAASTVVEIIAVPTVFKVNSPTICYDATAALSATVSNVTESTIYTWVIDGATTTTPTNTYTTPALTATVNYTVQIPNETGCTSTVSAAGRITVHDAFNPGSISSGTQTICKDAAVTTIGNAQGPSGGDGNYSYRWIHNGAEVINENTATFQPTAYRSTLGTHTFTREVYGCDPGTWEQSANTWTLIVIDLPATPFNASSVVICAGNTATFSASVTAEATIDWYDALTGGNMVSPNTWSYTPASSLTATTSYYAEASNTVTGCVSAERLQVTTTVNVVPTVKVSSASICYGSDATLTANPTDATDPATYTWEINGAPETTINTNTYTMPASTEPITYTVQVTNDTGCMSTVSDAGTITVYDEFFPGAITKSAETICSSDVVETEADPATGGHESLITYQWQHNGMNISGATVATYTPLAYNTEDGAHTFTRLAKDGECQIDFIPSAGSYVLTVNPRPATPVSASSVVICAGNTATFSASLSESDGVTIDWYDALTGGSTVCANSLSYTTDSPLTATTSYYAAAKIIATGCLSTARLRVTTTVNPLPVIMIEGLPETSPQPGETLTLTAFGAFSGGSYCFSESENEWPGCTYTTDNMYTVIVPEGATTVWIRAITTEGCKYSTFITEFSAGAGEIASSGTTAILGYQPRISEPKNEQPATVEATYVWRREGTQSAWLANGNGQDYNMDDDLDGVSAPGTYYYRRYAHGRYLLAMRSCRLRVPTR